jgi:hypothetical protein
MSALTEQQKNAIVGYLASHESKGLGTEESAYLALLFFQNKIESAKEVAVTEQRIDTSFQQENKNVDLPRKGTSKMIVQQLIELLQLSPRDMVVRVQTVDGRFDITGTSDNHQGIPFTELMIDTIPYD